LFGNNVDVVDFDMHLHGYAHNEYVISMGVEYCGEDNHRHG
jgi:hypothetical protein